MKKENPWVFLLNLNYNFDKNYKKREKQVEIPVRDVATIFFVQEAVEEYGARHNDVSLSWAWDFPFHRDTSPARSAILDLTIVSINGWWIQVVPMAWKKRSGLFCLDKRVFNSTYHPDFYVPTYLKQVKDRRYGKYLLSGYDVRILGYLPYEMVQNLKGVYSENYYAVFVESPNYTPCLSLDKLFGMVSQKREEPKEMPVLGQGTNELFLALDKMPEEIFLRILSSEEAAEQYISAHEKIEAEIDAWQAEELKK